jgi:hypothetical protein
MRGNPTTVTCWLRPSKSIKNDSDKFLTWSPLTQHFIQRLKRTQSGDRGETDIRSEPADQIPRFEKCKRHVGFERGRSGEQAVKASALSKINPPLLAKNDPPVS